jgi:tetratricopeptide (TPR) repeat protein
MYTGLGLREGEAIAYNDLANAYNKQGQTTEAQQLFTKYLTVATEMKSNIHKAAAWMGLGNIHVREGRYSKAIKLFTQSLRVFIEECDWKGQLSVKYGLYRTHLHKGEVSRALICAQECLAIAQELGDTFEQSRARELHAICLRGEGRGLPHDHSQGIKMARVCLARAMERGDRFAYFETGEVLRANEYEAKARIIGQELKLE